MTRAVIVDAVRTAGGKRGGQLSGWHPAELAAETLRALVLRTGLDPVMVDDVLMGCVTQVGAQSTNVGRSAVLAAGWPESVPATTMDRQCGSSQQAIHFAAQGVLAGAYDVVVAAGVECMTTVPMFSNADGNLGDPYGEVVHARYADRVSHGEIGLVSQGVSAELVCDEWDLRRNELDEYGAQSQQRAAEARDAGRFDSELLPVAIKRRDRETGAVTVFDELATSDEGIRSTSVDKLADLKPAFLPDGRITAGNSSQITDGAAAVLIMSEERARALGMTPLAVFVNGVLAATDPVVMLTAPIPATRKLLDRAKISAADVDRYEVNEAFAPVVLAWQRALGVDSTRCNVNGGGIALGHPLGASGAKLMATLVAELTRTGGRYGVQTMCEGGGMANATLVQRWDA